ncbi:MAG: serpin family protein [Anaerolineales bacterium]
MKKIYTLITCLVSISMMLSACTQATAGEMAQSKLAREKKPASTTSQLQTLVDGNNAFAWDMYQTLHSENGNLILSPYSISLALAMTYAGARGNTESQMADALHFTQGQILTHTTFNALDLGLSERAKSGIGNDQQPMRLNIANAVWAEKTLTFLDDFLNILAVNYGAGVHLADFKNSPDPERLAINSWVSNQTEKKINDLLPDGSITPDTRMVLVNAIYFKADWANQFDANSTYDATFHLLDGSEISTPTMNEVFHGIPYVKGNGYQAIELAYSGQSAAMDIILPDEGNFDTFEASFNQDVYHKVIQGLQESSSVSVSLPKFQFTKDFSLSNALQSLGMVDAFDSDNADFSGMTGKKDLYISNVIHKAFVAVDEKGTEAAAATAVIMEAAGAIMPEASFVADRPFIFVIRDTNSGQILFIGRILNPQN